jgi:hypothetical protein
MGYYKWWDDEGIRKRTRAVFDLLSAGYKQGDIAKVLGVTQATVSYDFRRLMDVALYGMGTDPVLPYILDLRGVKGCRKEIAEGFKALESDDATKQILVDYLELRRKRLPEGA